MFVSFENIVISTHRQFSIQYIIHIQSVTCRTITNFFAVSNKVIYLVNVMYVMYILHEYLHGNSTTRRLINKSPFHNTNTQRHSKMYIQTHVRPFSQKLMALPNPLEYDEYRRDISEFRKSVFNVHYFVFESPSIPSIPPRPSSKMTYKAHVPSFYSLIRLPANGYILRFSARDRGFRVRYNVHGGCRWKPCT